MTTNTIDTGNTPPLRSREIELDNLETFQLLQAAARAAKIFALSDAQKGKLIDVEELIKKSLSDAAKETSVLSDAPDVAVSLSDAIPIIRHSALTKLGIISTPGRHLIFTHKGAKQICLVGK